PIGPAIANPLNSLSSLPAYDPLAAPGFGATANPFADLGNLGGGNATANPYSSPRTASFAARPKPALNDSKRRGLPWDIPDEENAFFGTLGKLVNSMGADFAQMKCTGGFLRPMM